MNKEQKMLITIKVLIIMNNPIECHVKRINTLSCGTAATDYLLIVEIRIS